MSGRNPGRRLTWTFSIEASAAADRRSSPRRNPFTAYAGEILRAEGFSFATFDASFISPTLPRFFDTVVLGRRRSDAAHGDDADELGERRRQPDRDAARTSSSPASSASPMRERRSRTPTCSVDTLSAPGAGIVGRRSSSTAPPTATRLNGATSVATLYSNATTATTNPAVTLRSVGANGGQAAAFTYDLARSVVLTRQGNPAWVGQERDGVVGIRPDDLFFGAKAGDVQPDWLDTNKIGIPQADEQQRLLANLIETMAATGSPCRASGTCPRGEKAAVVMTGDDHAFGGTAGRFDQYKAASPAGCSVVELGVRPLDVVHLSELAAHECPGGAVRLRRLRGLGSCRRYRALSTCTDWTPASLDGGLHHAAAAVRGEVHERARPGDASAALRRLGRLGDAAEGRARPRHPASTRTTTTIPGAGSVPARGS